MGVLCVYHVLWMFVDVPEALDIDHAVLTPIPPKLFLWIRRYMRLIRAHNDILTMRGCGGCIEFQSSMKWVVHLGHQTIQGPRIIQKRAWCWGESHSQYANIKAEGLSLSSGSNKHVLPKLEDVPRQEIVGWNWNSCRKQWAYSAGFWKSCYHSYL